HRPWQQCVLTTTQRFSQGTQSMCKALPRSTSHCHICRFRWISSRALRAPLRCIHPFTDPREHQGSSNGVSQPKSAKTDVPIRPLSAACNFQAMCEPCT
uniref:Uncharacterized protein n=1 Tax=Aegilops tauschii subsp. strangulata TaxID=200361 RepID=A0A453J2V1_AEGTS